MSVASHAPVGVELFLDPRGDARSLRVRRHDEAGLVVLSLWRGDTCTGTFRLRAEDVPALIELLRGGPDLASVDLP